MLKFVPKIFFPENERPIITASFKFPEGTPISKTDSFVRDLEDYFQNELQVNKDRERGILDWVVYTGGGEPRFTLTYSPSQSSPNSTIFIINISEAGYVLSYELRDKIRSFATENYPDIQLSVKGIPQGSTTPAPFEVRISGTETNTLFKIVKGIKEKLNTIDGAISIEDNWGLLSKKFVIDIKPDRTLRAGVTHEMIANSLQNYLVGFEGSQLREGENTTSIVLRSSKGGLVDMAAIESIQVFNPNSGKSIALKQVADLRVEWQSSRVFRRDRLKTITVSAMVVNGMSVNPIFSEVQNYLDSEKSKWPTGFGYEFGGEKEGSSGAMDSVISKFPLAGMIIVLLLIIQFNSIKKSLLILLTIPLGMIGVTTGLLLTGETFGFMAFLGVVSLSGIIINNAIVLIDRIQIEIEEFNRKPFDALIEAGQRRLMPIVMTTVSTIGGLFPLWLYGGSMWSSMAVTIMFGLLAATILTLCFVPSLYSIFFRVKE